MILASNASLHAALSLGAVAAYVLAAAVVQARARLGRTGMGLLLAAWLLHGAVLAMGLLSSPPRFGFGPALSGTAWMALLVYGVESRVYPLLQLRWRLALAGAGAVLVAWLFPGWQLQARTSELLPLHLALGMASYGLFAVALLHAWLMARAEQRMRRRLHAIDMQAPEQGATMALLTLERLTFRFVVVGFVLLTATILQGLLFGEHLYGGMAAGAWRWSHKTVFSLLSWGVFAALLWGRWRRGWRGQRAVRMVYAGAMLLVLGYMGSHFVLEVLLRRGL